MRIQRTAVAVSLVALAFLLGPHKMLAASCVWDGMTGDWTDAAHWTSCGVGAPGAADTASIASGTVHVTTTPSVGGLTFSGGTIDGAGTLTISSGTLAWSGGAMSGTGTTVIAGGATLTISAGVALQRTLTNNGTGTWTGGRIDVTLTGLFNNAGTFDIQTDNGYETFGGANAFNNSGTLTKSAGASTTYFGGAFNNTGTVNANSGTINLNGGGTSTGDFAAGTGAVLNFNGGTQGVTLAGGKSFSGLGTIGFTNSGTTTVGGTGAYNVTGTTSIGGGTLNLNIPSTAGTWTETAGNLSGSALVTVSSGKSYTWSGGAMSGTGTTVIAGGATLTISAGVALQRTLTNNGTGTWTGGRIDVTLTGLFNNAGTFDIQTDNGYETFGGANAFNNSGTLTKSAGASTTYFGGAFNNTGTVNANSGTINLNGGGTSTGDFAAGTGAVLNFNGGTQGVTLAGGKSFSGLGTIGFTNSGTTTVGGTGAYNVTGTTSIGGGTLNLNIPSTAGTWTETAGNLSGSALVTVSSGKSYTWSGGAMSGTGTTVIAGGATLTISAGVALQRTLTNNGTGTWTGGRIDVTLTGLFNNAGTFDIQTDNGYETFGGANAFNNSGTLTKSAGASTTYFGGAFNNTGTVNANSGTINLNGGGTSTGDFAAGTGAVLNFNGGTQGVTLAGGKSFSGLGTIGFTNSGTTTVGGTGAYNVTGTTSIGGGTLNLNIPSTAGTWTETAGNLSGSALVTVSSGKSYTWSGGAMSGTGTTVIAGGATLTISAGVALQRTLTNNGTGTWTGGRIDVTLTGLFNNAGTFDIQTDNGYETFGGANAFNNSGTLTKSAGASTTYFGGAFNNTGTVNANSGTINLNGGGTSTGDFAAGTGAVLNFNGGTQGVTLAGGKSFSGLGTIGFTNSGTTTVGGTGAYNVTGTTSIGGGTLNLNIPSTAGTWTETAGNLSGSALVTVSSGKSYTWSGGAMSGTGTTVIAGGATLTISAGVALQRTLTNNGTGTWTGGRIDVTLTGLFNNAGTFDIQTDNGYETFGGANAFNNSGTLTKSAGASTTYFGGAFNNTGTVNANSGTVAFNGVFTQTAGFTILNGGSISTTTGLNIQGGTLKGKGAITGNVFNGGTVAPGLSPGVLTVDGSYSQTSSGTLSIEVNGLTAGTQYDQLIVNGPVAVAGTLSVTSGFTPSAGDGFVVLVNHSATSVTGIFEALPESAVLTALPAKYRVTYLGNTGNDVVLEAGPAASAQSILVDATASAGGASDGNGVFEPGETVGVKPTWKNQGTDPISLSGTASNLTGLGAAGLYSIGDAAAVYGSIAVNATADCGSNCYSLMVADPATRPTTHWDAHFTETPSTLADPPKVWTLHLGDSFIDVPRTQLFYKRIETLVHNAITAGCATGKYCPSDAVTRDQMAIFLAKGIAGGGPQVPVSGSFQGHPYNCVAGAAGASLFSDVQPTDSFCKHVHYMAVQNVTLGCSGGNFCPHGAISRSDMAIFVAKAIAAPGGGAAVPQTYTDAGTGLSYSCNPASPNLHFTDIGTSDTFCKHVHFLWARGIVSGCAGTNYCPTDGVTRDQMARFLGNAFNLVLYAP